MTKRYTVATGWTTGSSDHRRWPCWLVNQSTFTHKKTGLRLSADSRRHENTIELFTEKSLYTSEIL